LVVGRVLRLVELREAAGADEDVDLEFVAQRVAFVEVVLKGDEIFE